MRGVAHWNPLPSYTEGLCVCVCVLSEHRTSPCANDSSETGFFFRCISIFLVYWEVVGKGGDDFRSPTPTRTCVHGRESPCIPID